MIKLVRWEGYRKEVDRRILRDRRRVWFFVSKKSFYIVEGLICLRYVFNLFMG